MSKITNYTVLIIVLAISLIACNNDWSSIENKITSSKTEISDTLTGSSANSDEKSSEHFYVPTGDAIEEFLGQKLSIEIKDVDGTEITLIGHKETKNLYDRCNVRIEGVIDGYIEIKYDTEDAKVSRITFVFESGKKIICDKRGS